ncbi:MAG: LamG domain-containing protein, partial [Verrucomicrobia bacterium]|nr:LamG domain-containing protein [Verrucomicrobiota bacterium]
LLHREDAKPFRVTAEWMCYDRYFSGVGVQHLDRYLARRPTRARVVVRGPDGSEAASLPITIAGPQDPRSGKAGVALPAGPPGAYRLAIEDAGELHFKLRLASCELTKCGYSTQNAYLACGDAYHFYVPPETARFELAFKTLALRRPVTFTVCDPAGQPRKQETTEFGASPAADYTAWAFDVEPAHRGKLWRFTVTPPHPEVEQTYLKFQSIPPVVWTTPESFFLPAPDALRPRPRPAPVAEPYAGAGTARRIEAGKPLVIARGETLGSGRHKNLNAQQGTLEFWFRPEWADDDLRDHSIARCGQMRLYRRSRLGIYLGLGGTRQSGFITEPGQWYHLAITWDAGAPGRAPRTALFINGFEATGTLLSPVERPLGDWTGDKLMIGGEVACSIDDLRLSDVVRYPKDFNPPTPPPADEHTLARDLF